MYHKNNLHMQQTIHKVTFQQLHQIKKDLVEKIVMVQYKRKKIKAVS
jgi:hypothetical protein